MAGKRIFISFALEDTYYRDLLKAQSLNTVLPFSYTDMPEKDFESLAWQTNCRTRIRGCDGVIVLLSKKTEKDEATNYEIRCALEEDIPILGVYVRKERCNVPSQLNRKKVIDWDWEEIAEFIDSL